MRSTLLSIFSVALLLDSRVLSLLREIRADVLEVVITELYLRGTHAIQNALCPGGPWNREHGTRVPHLPGQRHSKGGGRVLRR